MRETGSEKREARNEKREPRVKNQEQRTRNLLVPGVLLVLLTMNLSREDLLKEITFKTSRSGGKGGQHVNKVSSKVELNINIKSSNLFTEEQKLILLEKLSNRINSEGVMQVVTEEDRSQLRNKEKGLQKLIVLLANALQRVKPRKITRPGKSAVEKRLKQKQAVSLKKINRRTDSWQ
jgi:ribosome-associated protein